MTGNPVKETPRLTAHMENPKAELDEMRAKCVHTCRRQFGTSLFRHGSAAQSRTKWMLAAAEPHEMDADCGRAADARHGYEPKTLAVNTDLCISFLKMLMAAEPREKSRTMIS